MKELTLFSVDTPYRQPLHVKAFSFGNPEKKTLAVVGALRGNEIQQMYICSQLVKRFAELEGEGLLSDDFGMLIIPCANQFSMNVGRRFWAADNTDINRMFPGYGEGETTQRIADGLFTALKDFTYGIHFTSHYLHGDCAPSVRIIHTGYEDESEALELGLPFVSVREPKPYDTTTLNYNWQIWDTAAFSVYSGHTESIDTPSAEKMVKSVMHFLEGKGMLKGETPPMCEKPRFFRESILINMINSCGGIFIKHRRAGERLAAGEVIADILNPSDGSVQESLVSPCAGTLYFVHRHDLISGHEIAARVLPDE